jgi:hypothetical protein
MTLQALLDVLFPPEQPREPGDAAQWRQFEATTGLILPDDYKAFINTFGTGHIEAVIFPYNPFCKRPPLKAYYDYATWSKEVTAIKELKDKFGEDVFPFPIYPDPGGLLPWGSTDTGDRLLWQTADQHENWSIVINESRSKNFELFACSMTNFLQGLITGDIHSEIIAPYIFETRLFEPY